MRMDFRVVSGACLLLVIAAPALSAAPRSVGQTLVYAVTTTSNRTSSPPPSLPASMRAQYEAMQAKAAQGSTSTFTFTIDRVDPNGNAHLKGTLAGPAVPAAAVAIVPYLNTLQATLAPDGRIIPTYDPNMPPATTRDNKYHEIEPTEASAQNTNAGQFHADEFNHFAQGCAKRGHLKPGDSWHLQTRDAMSQAITTYDFSVSAPTSAGAPAVSMNANVEQPNGTRKIEATGHYDPAANQVLDLHVMETYDTTSPYGRNSGSLTTDFTLQH